MRARDLFCPVATEMQIFFFFFLDSDGEQNLQYMEVKVLSEQSFDLTIQAQIGQ